MKKRYTSDPKQASRRNAFTNHKLKKSLLILLGFLLLGGGMKAIGQTAYTLNHTSSDNKTYYVTSTNEVATSANNTTASGPQAYKFYVSETPNPTSGTKYDHFYNVRVNNADATVTFIFQTDKPVGFSNGTGGNLNAFRVTKGTLIMKLDEDYYNSDITLRRVGTFTNTQNSSCPFYLINDAGAASHQRLIIEGLDPKPEDLLYPVSNVKQDTATYLPKRQFVIDGAANITSVNMTTGVPTYTGIATNKKPLFRVETGTLHLTNVTIQNSINSATEGPHGGIYLMLNDNASQTSRNLDVILTHCWLHNLVATNNGTGYPGIGLQWQMRKANGSGSVVLKRSKFSSLSNKTGQEAAIRSTTGCKASVTIDSCNINNNFGGGIRWQGLVADPMQVKNTTIKGNYTKKSGGGIIAKSPLVLTACKILNNTAYEHGGGINYMCYDEAGMSVNEAGMIYPKNLELTMDAATIIDGNKTETGNGGGIMVWGRLINLTSTGQMGYVYHEYNQDGNVVGPYKLKVNLNGATISNNEAYQDGGGIYIVREEDASCYFLKCQLNYGNITGNKTTTGNGGGLCIKQTGTPNSAYVNSDHPAQDIEFYTGGGTNDLNIKGNKAYNNGGGIYLYSINSGVGWTSDQIFNTIVNLNDKTLIQKDTAATGNGGGIYLEEGTMSLNQATIGGDNANLGNIAHESGGGIFVNKGSVNILSSNIFYNEAQTVSGGGIFVENADVSINPNENETSTTKIAHNKAHRNGGGLCNRLGRLVIFGSFDSDNTYRVEITDNEATNGSGGGIFCKGDASSEDYDIRMRRVLIQNNEAKEGGATQSIPEVVSGCGGGIYLHEGKISIINGKILSNKAKVSGGGVYTHSGNINFNITREERNPSEIRNNTAEINGGGLNTHQGLIRVLGNNSDKRIVISGNTATTGSGGGIFCMGEGSSTEYITLLHADLINNEASNGGGEAGTGVTAGCGGGLYLQQGKIHVTDVKIQNNYAKVNGGGINNHSGNIDVNGCLISGNTATTGSGGGIYTNAGDIDIEDYVETEGGINRYESKITYNEAVANGGGINTHQGTITINGNEMDDQIEISFNKANKGGGMYANAGTIKAYNALIHDNTATENGGGINNHSGDITLYGGMLSNNIAKTGHGGGAYTNVGDIDLFQFPSTKLNNVTLDDGTKIYNNIALKNGGAFNNHTGRVDVRHATLYNNTATQGNGGAIFCEGPHANVNRGLGYTIRLLCSDMVQNKTRGQDGTETEPTGRGGGIYLKYGSIYAHYSNILNNEANISGGGLDNHNGDILLYGCDIIGNRAIELDGGGIYTLEGNITTGPSTEKVDAPATPSRSKATVIQKNTAHYNGGGIKNEKGNITLNGDLVGGTVEADANIAEKGHGGGIHIANGIINMYGGKIAHNKAEKGHGGGVYSGGGQFNIEKRDDNPKPIVVIVDSEVNRVTDGQTATIHYHLVDQGKYTGLVANSVKSGIEWWREDIPETVYTVIYNETASYSYEEGEKGCLRIVIPKENLAEDKSYKVKAFYQYSITSPAETVTGYSEVTDFRTFSDSNPLVISGTVSNITKNSATGSGKIMDNGGSPITFKGVQIWEEGQTPDVSSTYLKPSTDETDYFSVNLTGLNPNALYHARAYATNVVSPSLETDYTFGATVDFTTLKNTPDMGSGPLTVTTDINSVGQIVVTASYTMPVGTTFGTGSGEVQGFGFVWSTDDDPELYADHTIAGVLTSGTTTFTAQYVGAREGIAAYVRAYATYVESTVTSTSDPTNYSITNPKQFFTPYLNGDPVVRAINISNITQHSATITCEIFSGYIDGTTIYGVHLENNDSYHYSTNYDSGIYTVELTGLNVNTTYYLKAFATNDGGTTYSYGNGYNFTTLPVSKPQVLVQNVNVTINPSDYGEVKVTCLVESDGGEALDATGNSYGIIYDTIVGTSTTQHASSGLSSSGEYTYTITGLKPHGNYWVKAYATNSAGTHISQPVPFTTNYDKPSVVMTSVTNTATPDGSVTNATANFTVAAHSTNASDEVKTYGVCWSILHNPTRSESVVSDTDYEETTDTPVSVTDPQSKSKGMKQRFPNTKYFVRAYASTNTPSVTGDTLADIVYTAETHFITMPALLTGAATEITNNTAVLGGTINSRDSQGYLVNGYYGVCWGTSANPERTAITPYNPSTPNNFTEVKITNANANIRPFSLLADSLTAGETYYYRAYYISPAGEIAYGPDAASTFATYNFSLTVVCDPAAGGTVDKTYVGLNNGDNCSVTATPNPGYSFTSWIVSGTGASVSSTSAATTTFTMGTENATLTAHFTAINYTVSLTADPAAGGTVTGDGSSFTYNDEVTITATPADGYHFVSWTDNDNSGAVVSTNEEYTFNVTGNVNYTANFEANTKSRSTAPRPRDIYPAPAREPWDWDDDSFASFAVADTLPSAIDSLIQLREQMERDAVEPANIPSIDHNSAEYGGGIFMEYTDKTHTSEPTKLVFTGGAKTDPVKGQINFNYASEAGGGIYISDSAYMQMKGHCEVNANRVPEGKRGGGIYLKGRLYVGDNSTDPAGTHGLIVNKNYAVNVSDADFATNYEAIVNGTADVDTTNKYKKNLNNVFLTRYESDFVNNWEDSKGSADYDDLATVITLLSDISGKDGGTNKPYSNIGFSVLRGFCPVIATSASLWGPYVNTNTAPSLNPTYEGWLFNLMKSSKDGISGFDENGALFEDSETYVAIHTRTKSQPFLPKYIYLWGCWTYPAVKEDPESNRPMVGSTSQSDPASDSQWQGHYVITDPENDGILHWDIYSEEGLSWFSSYVNGLNVFKTGDTHHHDAYDATKNPYATATLMNDVDLRSHIWTPIGSVTSFQDSNLGGSSSLFNDDPAQPHHFKGSFDGQGHTIKGMNVRYVSGIYKYGLFGYLDDAASVKNVFIDDSEFITDSDIESYHVGGVAGLVTSGSGKNIVISASEARVQINVSSAKKATSYVGGLVGKVEGAGTTTIHSSMAMPEIKGSVKQVGGLVGELTAGNKLYNSFANPSFPDAKYTDTIENSSNEVIDSIYFGGLVGINHGIVDNCYSRLQGTEPLGDGKQTGKTIYGWFAGTNNGTIQNSYALKPTSGTRKYIRRTTSPGNTAPTNHGTYTATSRVSGKYGFKHRDQQLEAVSTATYITNDNNDTLVGGLLMAMNAWVNAKNKALTDASQLPMYHPWMRTMASTINDDLPIPQFKVWTTAKAIVEDDRYNAVGSKDGVYIDYKTDVNELLTEYAALTDPLLTPSIYLYDANTESDGTTLKNITVTNIGTSPEVKLAIHEDVGIKQDVNLNATVGVTFDNSDKGWLGGQPYDWHMFSSAIQGVPMGLRYHTDAEATSDGYYVWANYSTYLANGIPNSIYNGSTSSYDRDKMDPPMTQWYQSNNPGATLTYAPDKVGYFPTDTPYGTWRTSQSAADVGGSFDLYCYGEEKFQHWINFKRRGDASFYDHWRQDPTDDGHHLNIPYPNEERFINGKGYLMAVSERSMLMAEGTLNNGTVTYNATYTVNPMATVYDEMVRGTNLIGNPYQSYLDMDQFFTENSGVGDIYYIMDADKSTSTGRDYISYTKGSSPYNPDNDAPPFLHPHQGFFVKVPGNTSNSTTSIIFNADMRVAGKWNTTSGLGGSHFRDRINYPLVNLLCYDSNNKGDITTVEINRPEVGGGQKMKGLRSGKAILYSRFEDGDYQTLFAPEGVSEVPVRFEANEDDVFTMKWSMYNGNFNYVHLIDNLTGADVDMLAAQEYKFEGRTTDYISRFKLVFKVTDVDEYKDDDPGSKTFAFQMGDELIVNGAGILQMFDVTGRCLLSTQTAGAQSSVSLPKVAAGVYMLRLTGNQQNKVQKIIIK